MIRIALHVDATYSPSDDDWVDSGHLRGWHAVTLDGVRRDGETASEWWRWLATLGGDVTVYGSRMWPAVCLLDLRAEIDNGHLTMDLSHGHVWIAADPPTILILAQQDRRIVLLDTANYGIPDQPTAQDVLDALADYVCLLDTTLGNIGLTAAGEAWRQYQMQAPPFALPSSEEPTRLEQAAYFGGRLECYRIGRLDGHWYHLDVSAMYTALAQNALFPAEFLGSYDPPPSRQHIDIAPDTLVIADVTLWTDKPLYPADSLVQIEPGRRPDPDRGLHRIIYPVGEFRTALCGPELDLAIAHGHIGEWHRVQYYRPAPLMREWSEWALDLRARASLHLAGAAKKLINSLPGKWGQRRQVWVDHDPIGSAQGDWCQEWGPHPGTAATTQWRTVAGRCQYLDRTELAEHACPAVAAWWTSLGRVWLEALIACAQGSDGDHVAYVATDSLIVDECGYQRLIKAGQLGDQPGQLRIVEETDDLEIRGLAAYRFGRTWHVAGASAICKDGTGSYTSHEGATHQLWRRHLGRPAMVRQVVAARGEYRHARVRADGRVEPFRVG